MLRKRFKLQDTTIDGDGSFEGYASVFDVTDSDGDIIQKGAFSKAVQLMHDGTTRPKMCWQHNWWELIGTWKEMAEDDKGLKVKGQLFLDLERGREAHILMKAGEIDSMSIGFDPIVAEKIKTGDLIKEVDLWEVSLVTFPANDQATITQSKSVRDFENYLRDAGYSRKDAVTIASHGFKAILKNQGEPDYREIVQSLNNLQTIIND